MHTTKNEPQCKYHDGSMSVNQLQSSLREDADSGEAVSMWAQGFHGLSGYLSLNFAVNLLNCSPSRSQERGLKAGCVHGPRDPGRWVTDHPFTRNPKCLRRIPVFLLHSKTADEITPGPLPFTSCLWPPGGLRKV